jgi:hypothetical protein
MSHGAGAPRLRGDARQANAARRRRAMMGIAVLLEEAARA